MTVTTFGRILECDEKLKDWIQYSNRLEHCFTANEINDANKKRVILFTVIRPKAYKLLQNLIAPEKLEDKSYTDLVEAMKKHHNPKPSEIIQQHKFFRQPG